MKRLLSLFAFLLLCALPALAQNSTTVTINVTDAGGQTWNNGTYFFDFVGDNNSTWPGGALPIDVPATPGALNGSGSATQSVPSNATIQPQPNSWLLTVCPNPAVTTNSGCFNQNVTISGATQTLTVTPPAIVITVPTVATQINPVVAYADAEISGGWVGFSYYNVTSAANRQCTTVSAGSCTTWQVAGGSSVSLTATSPVVITPSPTTGTGVISCPTCFATGSVPTLDQIGNPAAVKTFALGTNNPLSFTSAGLFTNTQQNEYLVSSLNSCSPGTMFSTYTSGSPFATDAIAGCVTIPSSGVSNAWTSALSGYVSNGGAATGCPINTFCAGVGVSSLAVSTATGNGVWGLNSRAIDTAGHPAELLAMEGDVVVNNTATTGFGISLSMFGTSQPTGDNFPAYFVGLGTGSGGGPGFFTTGFECGTGEIASNSYNCVLLSAQASGASKDSQYETFKATDSASVAMTQQLNLSARHAFYATGHVLVNWVSGHGEAEGYGVGLTSTNNLTLGQLVKIDTANADSVVVCTTADVLCTGFMGNGAGGGANPCNAGDTFCAVITVPGSVVKGILGTGTCTVGNWVIVDTTTNGDVKCATTQPPAWQGFALAANSSVGTAFDVLVSPGGSSTGGVAGKTYTTATNCSSSASPAVCGSAAAGSIAVPTGTNATLVVNTTAVTANSQIFVQSDDTLGTKLGVTCNSTLASLIVEPVVSARTGGTSFTVTISGTTTTNPVCLSYFIVN